ncbi:MAG TPA: DUF2461 domain-containing protein [Patescibacteria group bacterium]|nr:DUF2461 domain-containing protein [Patescibacteria group bacterium]
MGVATTASAFTGFRPEAVQFLADLTANNDRAWFQPRKTEYEELLKRPLEALCVALADEFASRGLPLRADPAKSPFRIYRDVRFAKDKSPYKTNVGASFPWTGDADVAVEGRSHTANVHSSGGYFHLSPGEIYVGGGYWHPEKPWLDAFRRRVATDPEEIGALLEARPFAETFGSLSRDGHVLQRVPAGYAADHPAAEVLKLKDVVFGRRLSDEEAESPDLPVFIAETLAAGKPLLAWLAALG